ncbi:MAG: alanine--tRNA ligase [Myxococcales bacterium]|nr:alanine--tRNA ligase [Myxococcales bacterium]
MTSSRELRRAFTTFFAERGHTHAPSGPLVLTHDPTLMFANAGMVQFKDVFTGKEKRPYTRATTAQKCIRISGKHNDLENVGVTARHHTFFEMLGNFSFGDYFKREAISFAWDLFVGQLGLEPERLVFTIFGGEPGYGPADDETAALWKEITGCDDDRIIRCGAKDNFWQMGDTGPCGPCTEIHYCLGMDPDPRRFGEEPESSGRGWFELWNLVFMQFDRQADGRMVDLPAPSVDTGAGLERLAVVKQGVLSNYDTDLLRPIVDVAAEISGKKYRGTQEDDDVSMRVLADHARTTAFLVSEGVSPDNEGTAYVLRRVMRRAIRHAHRLGVEELSFHHCTAKVVELMGDDYPQLREQAALIESVSREEEARFRKTLKGGVELLDKNEVWREESGRKVLPGDVAFKLYDTYGFPLDLQDVIGAERGFVVDHEGYDAALAEARERSRGSVVSKSQATEKVFYDIREAHGATTFVGYDQERVESTLVAMLRGGERVDVAREGEAVELVTLETPFYGEKGGQVGDPGVVRAGDAWVEVRDAQIPVEGLTVLHGVVRAGQLEVGTKVSLEVDHAARQATRRNHSATHLLHWALRQVVGPTAAQKGSLVGPSRLRFDYAASKPLGADEIRRIEDLVNEAVLANTPITTDVLPMDEAKSRGAIGIFEEKYGDVVRVLTIGPSLELCGGTHAVRTGDIGLFTILAEGGLAAGVRRIEAITGLGALTHLRETRGALEASAALLKAPASEVNDRVQKLLDQQKTLQKEIERLQKELVSGGGAKDLTAEARERDGVRFLAVAVPSVDGKALREMADQLRDKLSPAVVMLGTAGADGKVALVCSVSKEVTDRFRAGDLVKRAAAVVGGSGGGRPDFAQAGGSDATKLGDAVASFYEGVGV